MVSPAVIVLATVTLLTAAAEPAHVVAPGNTWLAWVARLIVPAVKVAEALVSALNCVLAVSKLLAWVDPTNVPPVRTFVALAAGVATASAKVAVAGGPPMLRLVEGNRAGDTPMVVR